MNITLFAGNFPPFPLKPDRNIYEWTVNLDFLRCQATIKWKEWITSATFEDIEVWWRHCWVCSNLFEPRWPVFIYTGCDPLPCPSVACIKLFKQPDKSTAGWSHWGKQSGKEGGGGHYTITLTCSTAMVTYLMNKSHYQGPDNSDTEPLLLWQTSASLSIFLSLCYLFFFFSTSLSVLPLYHLSSYISRSSRLADSAHFIYHAIVTLLDKAPHPHWLNSACESWEAQIIPLWFPVSHGIDSSGWSAQKRLTLSL